MDIITKGKGRKILEIKVKGSHEELKEVLQEITSYNDSSNIKSGTLKASNFVINGKEILGETEKTEILATKIAPYLEEKQSLFLVKEVSDLIQEFYKKYGSIPKKLSIHVFSNIFPNDPDELCQIKTKNFPIKVKEEFPFMLTIADNQRLFIHPDLLGLGGDRDED